MVFNRPIRTFREIPIHDEVITVTYLENSNSHVIVVDKKHDLLLWF